MSPTEFIYNTPLWKVRRLGEGWYQGESNLLPVPTPRTEDPQEARRWITARVNAFLVENGYVPGGVQ